MIALNGTTSHLPHPASGPGPAADEGEGEDDLRFEQVRLMAAIAAARKRAASARHRADSREDAARGALRAELAGAREALAEMERLHHDAVAALRADTDREIQSILDGAKCGGAEPDAPDARDAPDVMVGEPDGPVG